MSSEHTRWRPPPAACAPSTGRYLMTPDLHPKVMCMTAQRGHRAESQPLRLWLPSHLLKDPSLQGNPHLTETRVKISSVTSLAILYECGLGTLPPNPKSSSAGAGQESSLSRSGSGSYSRRELSVICTAKSVQVSPSIGNRVAEAQWDALDGQSLMGEYTGQVCGAGCGPPPVNVADTHLHVRRLQ